MTKLTNWQEKSDRRLERLIPQQELSQIAARIEDATVNGMLYDTKKREHLRARLAAFEASKH